MAQILQLRRGTTAQNDVFVGAIAEVTVDTDRDSLRVHDGTTVGGTEIANAVTATGSTTRRTLADRFADAVNVKDFGAVGDGVADDTAAIQAALDFCNTFGLSEHKPFLLGSAGTYRVTGTLTISCDCDLSAMSIVADGAAVSPVIRVGGTASNQITWRKIITLPKVQNNARPAGLFGSGIGVQLTNCNTCYITVPDIQFFEVGLSCGGWSQGFVYNTVNLLFVYDNKINVRLKPIDSGGWSNQNVFIGGRLGYTPSRFSGTTNAGSRDILLERWDTAELAEGGPNNNTFVNTSIEGVTFPEFSIDIQGAYNQFQNCRYEGTAAKNVRYFSQAGSGTNSNLIIGGYQAASINYTFAGAGASVYNCAINGRGNFIDTTGVGFSISTGGGAQPHIQGFPAGTTALGKSNTATDWRYRLAEAEFLGKATASAEAHLRLAWTTSQGRIYFGDGTVAPTTYMTGNETDLSFVGYEGVRMGPNNLLQLRSAEATLTGLSGATVTATNLIPAGSIVLGVTARVTTAITGATSFDIGDGTDADAWGDDVAIALNTTTGIANFTVTTPQTYTSAASVVLTANGSNFTDGEVKLSVAYISLNPPAA